MKGKTHDLNHDLTFSAHTINCECHSIRSMFRVHGMYNFGLTFKICCQFFNLIDLKIVSSRLAVCNLYLIQCISTLVKPKLVWTWLHRSFSFTTAQKNLSSIMNLNFFASWNLDKNWNKVQLFWEGHKKLVQSASRFWHCLVT